MVKLKYFYQGFVGVMQTKEFNNKEEAIKFLEENKDTINVVTANIEELC